MSPGFTGGGFDPDGKGLDIDPVTPVPVPPSIALMGLAFGALSLLARRRQKRAA